MQGVASLDVIDVASPCGMSWDAMEGSDTVRYCRQCRLNVYNVSEMDREQALGLVRQSEGRLCLSFFRRHDGTVLTRDCPVGVSAMRRRLARAIAGIAALVAFLAGGALFARISPRAESAGDAPPQAAPGPIQKLVEWLDPPPQYFIGDVCPPVPPTAQPPAPYPLTK